VGSYSLDQAAKLVAERFMEREVIDITASVPGDNELTNRSLDDISNSLKELVVLSTEQVKLNKILLKKLEERDSVIESQQRYIQRMNERETQLMIDETSSSNVTNEEEEIKKKSPLERIKDFFKK